MNLKQKLAVIILDVAILVELCIGMYAASQNPEEFTPAFMKTFFTLLVPTLIAGFTAVRLLRDRTPDSTTEDGQNAADQTAVGQTQGAA